MAIDIAELLQPIPGADPAGEDIGFSDAVDAIREARRSDDASLSQGDWQSDLKVADWRLVIESSRKLLSKQSKDLQVAVWLGEALIARDGFGGATDALTLLDGLLENFWEGLYPRLEGGDAEERASKLAWFNTYAGAALKKVPLSQGKPGMTLLDWQISREVDNLARQNSSAHQDALAEGKPTGEIFDKAVNDSAADFIKSQLEALETASAAFASFKSHVDTRMGRAAPSLAEIEETLKRALQIITKAARAKGLVEGSATLDDLPAASAGAEAGAGAAAFAAGVASGAMALNLGGGNAAATKANALRVLSEIAGFFKKSEPHSPVSFLIERAVAWADKPLDEWLAEVVGDDGVLSRIKDRSGIVS